ncbi:hypothetical protein SynPROSU1_00671 [Synechococcus sp. PROS-U-1]|nr:hypothetical protein SynPROSU1_00671 [Synechococcus sp. PROS-U-1]
MLFVLLQVGAIHANHTLIQWPLGIKSNSNAMPSPTKENCGRLRWSLLIQG